MSSQEALKKEIGEETGLEVEVSEPFNVFTFTKDNEEFKFNIIFLCDYISGGVNLGDEHSEYKWIRPGDFKQLESIPLLHDEIKKYVQKYEK